MFSTHSNIGKEIVGVVKVIKKRLSLIKPTGKRFVAVQVGFDGKVGLSNFP